MNSPAASPDLHTELLAWRRKVLSIVLWVVVALRTPQYLGLLAGRKSAPGFHTMFYVVFTVALGVVIALAVFRRLPHVLRGWGLLGSGYLNLVNGFFMGARMDGPLAFALLVLPVHAAIFLGRRAAMAAAGLSVVLYASLAWMLGRGIPLSSSLSSFTPVDYVISWLVVFLPMFVLLDRFTAQFERILSKEKTTRVQLEAEGAERRYLEGALIETSERERQSVGHELHDGVCQQITGAMLQCKVLERAAGGGMAPEAGQFQKIATLLDNSLGQVHDLARGLSPGTLTPDALVPSLRDLARRMRETFEVDCEVEAQDIPPRLGPVAATHLYRIAQESVLNAAKHGQPRQIMLRMSVQKAQLVLEVQNDGLPLKASPRDHVGMGLRIMQYRSELIGGMLELLDGTEAGFCVRCTVPLHRVVFEASS